MGGAPPGVRLILYTPDVEFVVVDSGAVKVRVREDGVRLVERSVDAALLVDAALELLPQLGNTDSLRKLVDNLLGLLEPRFSSVAEAWRREAKIARAVAQAIDAGHFEDAARLAEGYLHVEKLVKEAARRVIGLEEAVRLLMERAEALEARAAVLEKILQCLHEARNLLNKR